MIPNRLGPAPNGFVMSKMKCAGEQQWAVISVQSDEQWAGLVRALGAPAWATDPALATASGRLAAVVPVVDLLAVIRQR